MEETVIGDYIRKERKIAEQILFLQEKLNLSYGPEKEKITRQIEQLTELLDKINHAIFFALERTILNKPLPTTSNVPSKKVIDAFNEIVVEKHPQKKEPLKKKKEREMEMEREILRRIKRGGEKVKVKKERKPSIYTKYSNLIFSNISRDIIQKDMFSGLRKNLVKANFNTLPTSYISIMLFTTLIAFFVGILFFIFFIFFNIGVALPIITRVNEEPFARILKTFWIIFAVPVATFLFLYFYPSMEKKSLETGINQELPFVTIQMAAISESMIEPSKIFKIIIETHEYPHIEKEFTKIINLVNVYGFDLVSALKEEAQTSASKKLAELFNSVATTITSGSDLSEFFNKRAESLLFDYRLEREKYTRTAETFMDIYISVVIAAPMIFMLLLIMIKISGLGLNISTSLLTFLIVLGVAMINVIFLVFLHLKQPAE